MLGQTRNFCVSIYSKNKYQSYDQYFIEPFAIKQLKLKEALKEIGFNGKGRYFVNPETDVVNVLRDAFVKAFVPTFEGTVKPPYKK